MNKAKIYIAALLGNALEYYDFTLYAVLIGLIGPLFFPASDPATALLAAYIPYTIGLLANPVGSLVFGYIGDRLGRKRALGAAVLMMGIPTCVIGLLPSYNTIGWWAPFILCLCRFVQGVSLGGERSGAAIFILEHAPPKYRGCFGGSVFAGGAVGCIIASLVCKLVLMDGMPEWAWRCSFIIGFILSLLGLYIRRHLEETPEFLMMAKEMALKKESGVPMREVWRAHKKSMFVCGVVGFVNNINAGNFTSYIHTYLSVMHNLPVRDVINVQTTLMIFFGIQAPLLGLVSDKIGKRITMTTWSIASAIWTIPLFYILGHYGIGWHLLPVCFITSHLIAGFNGPTNAFVNTLFPAQCRYSGIAMSFSIGAALASFYPMLSQYLIRETGFILVPGFLSTIFIVFGACVINMKTEK